MTQNIAIVISAFEPDAHFLSLLEQLTQYGFCQIVVVDDGSGAEYAPYFEQARQLYGATVLTHGVNLGKGRAEKYAFNHLLTQKNVMGAVTVDSDGQHVIQDIVKVAQATLQNPDKLVLGCRDFKGPTVPKRSVFSNTLSRWALKLLCGVNLPDTLTGLRGFSTQMMKCFITTQGDRFDFELNVLIDTKEKGIDVCQVPVSAIYLEEKDTAGFHPLRDCLRIYSVFAKFILSSLSSYILDLLLFTKFCEMLVFYTPKYYLVLATVGARLISASYNYMINKKAVFKDQSGDKKVMKNYGLMLVCQLAASAFFVNLLHGLLPFGPMLTKMMVDSCLFVISFHVQRTYIFS